MADELLRVMFRTEIKRLKNGERKKKKKESINELSQIRYISLSRNIWEMLINIREAAEENICVAGPGKNIVMQG